MKQDIDLIHVHCRGHQELKHVYYTFWETQQMNKENCIYQYSYGILDIIMEILTVITPIIAVIFSFYVAPKTYKKT